MGPLEFLVVSFEGNKFRGEILPELERLREQHTLRVVDLLFVKRDEAGRVSSMEMADLADYAGLQWDDIEIGEWFTQDDIDSLGESLPVQSSVALVLVEHLWAVPLQEAIRRANGRLIAETIVPREVVTEVEELAKAS